MGRARSCFGQEDEDGRRSLFTEVILKGRNDIDNFVRKIISKG